MLQNLHKTIKETTKNTTKYIELEREGDFSLNFLKTILFSELNTVVLHEMTLYGIQWRMIQKKTHCFFFLSNKVHYAGNYNEEIPACVR